MEVSIWRTTWRKWREDNAAGFAASLAYYALFAVVPIFVLLIALAGSIFTESSVRNELYRLLSESIGTDAAEFMNGIIAGVAESNTVLAAIISGALALMGVLGIFRQLRRSLDSMWKAEVRAGLPWWRAALPDFGLFILLLAVGGVLVLSAIFSAILAAIYSRIDPGQLDLRTVLLFTDIAGSMLLTAILVYCILRFLPNVRLPGQDLFLGALFTAFLFTLGKVALNIYFQFAQVLSTFGAARTVIILLLWVYYSAQIFYLGAELTFIYSHKRRGPSRL